MSRFDDIEKLAFSKVHDIFGDVASWSPSDGSETITGKVLIQSNDVQFAVDDKVYYEDAQYRVEYYVGTFPGLYESLRKAKKEYVTCNGKKLLILGDEMKWDGKTFVLYCNDL